MKKLNLNLAGSIQSLTKEQMKKINGGYGPTCGNWCFNPSLGGCQNGTDGCTVCIGNSYSGATCGEGVDLSCSNPNSCPEYCPYCVDLCAHYWPRPCYCN